MYSTRSDGGSAGPEQLADALLLQRGHVFGGDDSATGDQDVGPPHLVQELADPGKQRHVRAGENREADHVHVLLHRRGRDHLGRLVQPGVDHLHAGVAQRGGHHLGAAVVAVEAGLGDQDADRAGQRVMDAAIVSRPPVAGRRPARSSESDACGTRRPGPAPSGHRRTASIPAARAPTTSTS